MAKKDSRSAGAAKRAKKGTRTLIEDLREEPLPTRRAIDKENQKMRELEHRIAGMLEPLDQWYDDARGASSKKRSKKKTKR